jgi:ABC-type dipeptide/oligopeptide/nickel transport system permease subunit
VTPQTKGRAGRVALVVLAAVSLGYPLLASFAPECVFGPDVEFPAQSVCSRTVGGLWRSIGVGLIAGGFSAVIALSLALAARRFGDVADALVTKSADFFFSLPDVLVLIAISFGVTLFTDAHEVRPPAFLVLTLSLAAVGWAAPTRMIRNRLHSLERQDFVAAAEALGATRGRILVHHLLPFIRDYVFAVFLLRVPAAILAESTVSFLGFGMPPDRASLGTYLGQNYRKILQGDFQVVGPAWALLLVIVIAFQWTGQGILSRSKEAA